MSFRPPRDWEAAYAADRESFYFGQEPSQIARTALTWFRTLGGDPAEAVALDLGSGEGRDTAFLVAAGLRVVARDIAPSGMAKMMRLFAARGLPQDRVDAAVEDVRAYAYPDAAFDLCLAANIFQFLPPDEVPGHIQRLQRATKPGGICAVGVFSAAMLAWGAETDGMFHAAPNELMAFFPEESGWLLLDRTEYWTYQPQAGSMAAFTYVISRKANA